MTDAIPHGKQIVPYGILPPKLIIRSDSETGLSVYVSVNDGAFLCREHKVEYVLVSFDGGPEKRWRCSASTGAGDAVFIKDENTFLSKIKSSSFLVFKADMVGHTISDYRFDLRELQWPFDPRRTIKPKG